jgi:K+-transporting ATPase ATPase C chain
VSEHLRPAVVLTLLFTVLTGILYPLAMTGIAQTLMPHAANGSLILRGEQVVGSESVGQWFERDNYFHPRPSATSAPDPSDPSKTIDAPYNAAASTGSNLGPAGVKLIGRVKGKIEALRAQGVAGAIPVDAVTASASGLDPHISPENALLQIPRIAEARKLAPEQVRALVIAHTEDRILGLLGEPRVNVLKLNLALDALTQ